MATFVLVHGAWHGGWCWRKVVPLLRDAGHEVHTPTLTGLGERAHLLTPAVDLETHVHDVTAVVEYEDLDDVVLVGHSYGGMVITGAAERITERLSGLVYLDAFVPADGESVMDLLPPARATHFKERAQAEGQGWLVPPVPLAAFGVADEADIAWGTPKIGPHPLAALAAPLRCPNAAAIRVPRLYIRCVAFANEGFDNALARVRASSGWGYRELATGHDAMITAPAQLAALLLESAAGARTGLVA